MPDPQTGTEVLTQQGQQQQQQQSSQQTNGFTPPAWYGDVKTPEVKAWLENKRYADVETLASSAFSSERLIGAEKAGRTVLLPKDDNDAEGRKALWAKLGVPETVEGYKLPLPTGDDGVFAKTAALWFHKYGIPAKAAEGIAGEWNAFIASQVKAGEEADKGRSEKALADLKVEWGHKFDENSEISRRGLRAVGKQAGLDDKDLVALESTLGTSKMLKMFAQIGQLTGESGFAGGDGGGGFGISIEQAQNQLNQIYADRSAGKINDFEWEKGETASKLKRLLSVVSAGQIAA